MSAGILLALGKYFSVYTYLVENHYITSIGVVGRFVYFFDIGIVLLSSIGLHDTLTMKKTSWQRKTLSCIFGYVFVCILIVLPFWIYAYSEPSALVKLIELFNTHTVSFLLIVLGTLLPGIVMCTGFSRPKINMLRIWILPVCAATTLLFYGWNFNPRVPAHTAYTPSPFVADLMEYREKTGFPARLYAAEHLPVTGNPGAERKLTDFISPLFSVVQKLEQREDMFECFILPIHADSAEKSEMTVIMRSGLDGKVWQEQTVTSEEVFKYSKKQFCLSDIPVPERNNLYITFQSDTNTNMKVFVSPSKSEGEEVYFIRVQSPTAEQLARSKKKFSVEYTPLFLHTVDKESQLMVRHIQAVAGSSSARWIGALSLKPYRSFIDSFFANDSDAFDGDGVHALTRNKKLVDMSGITHFIQLLDYGQTNDPMIDAGYTLEDEADTGQSRLRLYANPQAYPKAFIVPNGQFVAADDEVRYHLKNTPYDPQTSVFISGSAPPKENASSPLPFTSSATITQYTNTRVDITTTASTQAYVVLTDSSSLQWQTFIDDQVVPTYRANSVFKAAQIPSGTHVVSFRYVSPAIEKSKILTSIGILLALTGATWSQVHLLVSRRFPHT